eukprot:2674624-Alexandrium_andersonii.AAC.1
MDASKTGEQQANRASQLTIASLTTIESPIHNDAFADHAGHLIALPRPMRAIAHAPTKQLIKSIT